MHSNFPGSLATIAFYLHFQGNDGFKDEGPEGKRPSEMRAHGMRTRVDPFAHVLFKTNKETNKQIKLTKQVALLFCWITHHY